MNKDKENKRANHKNLNTPKETQEDIKEVSQSKSLFCTQKLQIPKAN